LKEKSIFKGISFPIFSWKSLMWLEMEDESSLKPSTIKNWFHLSPLRLTFATLESASWLARHVAADSVKTSWDMEGLLRK
jgi:hypothetical protein